MAPLNGRCVRVVYTHEGHLETHFTPNLFLVVIYTKCTHTHPHRRQSRLPYFWTPLFTSYIILVNAGKTSTQTSGQTTRHFRFIGLKLNPQSKEREVDGLLDWGSRWMMRPMMALLGFILNPSAPHPLPFSPLFFSRRPN